MKSILASLAALTFVLAGCSLEANDPTPELTTEPAPATATEHQPADPSSSEHTGTTSQAMMVANGEDCPAPCYTYNYGSCKYNGSCTHN